MKRLLFLAAVALTATSALAATGNAVVSWVPPTTYTDGSPLAPAAITGNAIDCIFTPTGGIAASCGSTPAQVAGNGTATGTVTLTYPPQGGRACFRVRVLVGAVSADPSNEACKDFVALKPSPASNVVVTVTVSITAP